MTLSDLPKLRPSLRLTGITPPAVTLAEAIVTFDDFAALTRKLRALRLDLDGRFIGFSFALRFACDDIGP
jgi:hypothetical protein